MYSAFPSVGWSFREMAFDVTLRLFAKVSLGFLVGFRVVSWVVMRPWVAISFVASIGPSLKEPTFNVLLKLVYWGSALGLYYWAIEIFVIFAALQVLLLCKKAWGSTVEAVGEYGFLRGILVAMWRLIPILIEPIFFGHIHHIVEGWVEKSKPQSSSLRRFYYGSEEPPRARGTGVNQGVVMGRDVPDPAMLAKWKDENLPLPTEGDSQYGMSPGTYYIVDYVKEEHDAIDVGLHWDLRWKHPTMGIVDAVAIPKHKYPTLGKPVGVVKSDAKHGRLSLKNAPYKAEGYGAGRTTTLEEGKALLWVPEAGSGSLHMLTDKGDAFSFQPSKNPKKAEYLMVRLSSSPKDGKPALHRERKMAIKDMSRHPEKIAELVASGCYAEVKYDGAMYWLVKEKGRKLQLVSRRPKHTDNTPVKHEDGYQGIDKAFWVMDLQNVPEGVIPDGTEIQVEVIATGKGSYGSIHSQTAALLNSGPVTALQAQEKGPKLIVKLLKVEKYGGKDWGGASLKEERQLRELLGSQSDGALHVPAARMTPEGAVALYEREKAMGREGIVLRGDKIYKFKVKETYDFKIVGIGPVDPIGRSSNVRSHKEASAKRNPGSKWLVDGKPTGAGQIYYMTDSGAIGKVGSGLTDEQRISLWEHPELYLGEDNYAWDGSKYVAKDHTITPVYIEVSGMSQSSSGVVRAPVLERIRFDK